jgi:hypothetical protein
VEGGLSALRDQATESGRHTVPGLCSARCEGFNEFPTYKCAENGNRGPVILVVNDVAVTQPDLSIMHLMA